MKTFLLVAGVDYNFGGVRFVRVCQSRMRRMVALNTAKHDLRFIIYDFQGGDVTTHDFTYVNGKSLEKVSRETPFTPITVRNYDRHVGSGGDVSYTFKDDQRGHMSIVDIYRAVREIGMHHPNTLAELSFFSHGWMGGPILVNSYDDGIAWRVSPPWLDPQPYRLPSGARDPDDYDPRSKDFSPPTMDANDLALFRAAFHADGFIWIWGCAFVRLLHEILYKIYKHPTYRSSGLSGETIFTVTNFTSEQVDLLEDYLAHELGGPFPDRRKVEIAFKHIKYFACSLNTASYSHQIATSTQVKTYGAFMGMYSDYDKGVRHPLMHVMRDRRHHAFYSNYLGFQFDHENRWYGLFEPGLTCPPP